MMIVFIALISTFIYSLSFSAFIEAETVGSSEQNIKSEYILKSLINYAAAVVNSNGAQEQKGPAKICPNQPWGIFRDGMPLPPDFYPLFGLSTEDGVEIALEITANNGGFPVGKLTGSGVDKYAETLKNLFDILGFDEDKEQDFNSRCGSKVFSPEEMVGNLIDYLDKDEKSSSGTYPGCEGELSEEKKFRNDGKISNPEELLNIPGFTWNRWNKLYPFVDISNNANQSGQISINAAKPEVLRAIDPNVVSEEDAQSIYDYIDSGENECYTNKMDLMEKTGVSDSVATALSTSPRNPITTYTNGRATFNVIARVRYAGRAAKFLQATIEKDSNSQKGSNITNPVLY